MNSVFLKRNKNAFFLTEAVMYIGLALLCLTLFFSLFVQAVRLYRQAVARENLVRQAVVCEETVWFSLRYGTDIVVAPNEVRYRDGNGEMNGFFVRNRVLYKRLFNGTGQPITGNDAGEPGETDVFMEPLQGTAYFSETDGMVTSAFRLIDRKTNVKQICRISVWPLPRIWRRDE